jgi:LacI family transcriptional regulator
VLTASILERLAHLGVRTPGHVSLVVWGEHAIDAYTHATLPRIAYPVDEIARRTARLLLARLAGSSAPPRVEVCATAFVPGSASPTEA